MSCSTNQNLILSAQDGNEQAKEDLLAQFKPKIVAIARKISLTSAKATKSDVDDFVQEGIIGFLNAIKAYNPEKGEFSALVSICVRNKILSALRSNSRANDIDDIENLEALSNNPLESFAKREEQEHLKKIIETKLTPEKQRVLELYLDGYSYKEIAIFENLSYKKVDNLIAGAKKILFDP